ncbi:uncharacterized protein LOC115666520 [Syzygium oleosum]|uniref:uncharacterized protein LOC115666520 n=1 Tax=Syzygium oleosum TaxID=219896 RepID=UPI0024BB4F38|nr:uncharacterized protein LOC115666520 [Syzygium oleosum]
MAMSYETGEVIDCVDFFKQPAFDHPLLKNYSIQIKPSSNQKLNGALNQVWWKYGKCPEGTIPIKRPQNHTNHHVKPLTPRMKRLNLSRNDVNADDGHEHAIVSLTGGSYNGARATINLWNPKVVGSEVSFSQIWLAAGPEEDINTVEAGWMVNRELSDSGQAEFFVYWTVSS